MTRIQQQQQQQQTNQWGFDTFEITQISHLSFLKIQQFVGRGVNLSRLSIFIPGVDISIVSPPSLFGCRQVFILVLHRSLQNKDNLENNSSHFTRMVPSEKL